jgi:hypothetical protein
MSRACFVDAVLARRMSPASRAYSEFSIERRARLCEPDVVSVVAHVPHGNQAGSLWGG